MPWTAAFAGVTGIRTFRVQPAPAARPRELSPCGKAADRSAPPRSTLSRCAAVYADATKTKEPPEPGLRHRSTRYEQPIDLLEPEARRARALVELDPRHALAPQVGSHHGGLHSSDAPRRKPGATPPIARRSPKMCEPLHIAGDLFCGGGRAGRSPPRSGSRAPTRPGWPARPRRSRANRTSDGSRRAVASRSARQARVPAFGAPRKAGLPD
jgi:hypothetical protein